MSRDALDEWFAQADDILTDWRPGGDAMHATPPADEDDPPLPARADWYREQQQPRDAPLFWTPEWIADLATGVATYPRQQTQFLTASADPAEARRRTIAELERLRATVVVSPGGPGGGWVVEIRDAAGLWRNLTTPRIAFPEAADERDDTP